MITIRKALPSDTPDLSRMALAMHAASPLNSVIQLDVASFLEKVRDLSASEYGIVIVVEKDGVLCGMIAGEPDDLWLNREHKFAQEVFWWVDQGYRGIIWLTLLKALVTWVVEGGCKTLSLRSSLYNHRTDKLDRIYKKLGFIPIDVFYMKGL